MQMEHEVTSMNIRTIDADLSVLAGTCYYEDMPEEAVNRIDELLERRWAEMPTVHKAKLRAEYDAELEVILSANGVVV